MTPLPLITCGRCSGRGSADGRACPECRGIGRGAMYGSLFLYWGRRIDGFAITLAKIKRVVDAVIDIALALLFLLGFGSLVLAVQATPIKELFTPVFWQSPNRNLLAFWLGVIAACLWYYRRVVAAGLVEPVKSRAYGETSAEAVLAAGPEAWETIRKLPRNSKVDVSRAYAKTALKAVDDAYLLARKVKHAELAPAHLFGSLLSTSKIAIIFGRLGLTFEGFKDRYSRLLAVLDKDELSTSISDAVGDILLRAYVEAYERKQPMVDVTEMFLPTMRADEAIKELLYDLGVTERKAENVVAWIRVQELLRQRHRKFARAARLKPKGAMNRAMTSIATPYLDRMSTDLTRLAALGYLAPMVGREKEFEALFRAIEGGGRSVVLVGQPGTGKDAIIEGIAQRMVEEDVPPILQDKRLMLLNISQLVSGATASEAQERLLNVFYEVARAGNIMLAVPNAAGMIGITAGTGGGIDLAQVFADELARGFCFAVATANPREYSQAIEGTPLGQTLIKIDVPEPETNDAILVLEAKAGFIEYQNDVFFSYDAVEAAVTLSDRYMHEQFLPEKAIEVAKEAAAYVHKRKGKNAVVSRDDVAAIMAEKTKIPLKQMTEAETDKLLKLEEQMHGRIIGQEQAVKAVAQALRRARAELREQTRPIANFLFLGPTGVGKTEVAKTLAETYFGSENAMIRLDMSEYQDKASLYKLIGEPAGEQSGGILSEAVRKQPFSLVLLDEIEKAHPDILTVFLQVMDDGRLTDNVGRTVDFTNVILIATSNAGAPFIQEEIRKGTDHAIIKDRLMAEQLKQYFRPEFLNRFDDIVVFSPLTESEIEQITRLMLAKVAKRLDEKGIVFEAADEAVKELARDGFDPAFGARPLRRLIQDRVDNAIADVLLRGQVGRRDKLILEPGGAIRIEKARKL